MTNLADAAEKAVAQTCTQHHGPAPRHDHLVEAPLVAHFSLDLLAEMGIPQVGRIFQVLSLPDDVEYVLVAYVDGYEREMYGVKITE